MGDWAEGSYKEVGKSYLARVDFETFSSFEDINIKNEIALETAANLTLTSYQEVVSLNKRLKEKLLR